MNAIEANAVEIISRVDFAPLEGRSILVTGGSGLLGTQIVAVLQLLPVERIVREGRPRQVQRSLGGQQPGV